MGSLSTCPTILRVRRASIEPGPEYLRERGNRLRPPYVSFTLFYSHRDIRPIWGSTCPTSLLNSNLKPPDIAQSSNHGPVTEPQHRRASDAPFFPSSQPPRPCHVRRGTLPTNIESTRPRGWPVNLDGTSSRHIARQDDHHQWSSRTLPYRRTRR